MFTQELYLEFNQMHEHVHTSRNVLIYLCTRNLNKMCEEYSQAHRN